MAANRALVTLTSPVSVDAVDGNNAIALTLQYVVINSAGVPIAGRTAAGQLITYNFGVYPGYNDVNNIHGCIQQAVQANEQDTTLQVFVL